MNNNEIKFGAIDVESGLVSEGYIENGAMKFKKIPWYKKLFAQKPSKIELIGTVSLYRQLIWSDKKSYFDVAVYRKYNPITNETECIYANVPRHGAKYFDVLAYEKLGQLIEK